MRVRRTGLVSRCAALFAALACGTATAAVVGEAPQPDGLGALLTWRLN